MGSLGNQDSTGNGGNAILFEFETDITGMSAAKRATIKVGTLGIADDTGNVFLLTSLAGTRSWIPVTRTNVLNFTSSVYGWRDNAIFTNRGNYIETSAHANVVVDLSAGVATMDIELYSDIFTFAPTFALITVEVAGYAPVFALATAVNTVQTVTVAVPGAGARQAKITNGLTSTGTVVPASPVLGTWVRKLAVAPGETIAVVPQFTVPSYDIVIADSIGVGANAPLPQVQGYTTRQRSDPSASPLAIEGYGFGSIWDDFTLDNFATLMSRLAIHANKSTSPAAVKFFIQRVVNDQFLNRWLPAGAPGVAAFGAADAGLAAQLRAAFPLAELVWQTIATCTIPDPNANAQTKAQFSAQRTTTAGTVANSRAVDGTTLITAADLSGDLLHPSGYGAGHANARRYANVRPAPASARFAAGPMSAGNTLKSAASAGQLDIGNNRTIIVAWQNTAPAVANDIVLNYSDPAALTGHVWIYDAPGLRILTRPGGVSLAFANATGVANAGFHCAAVTTDNTGNQFGCLDDNDPVALALGAYTNGNANAVAELCSLDAAVLYGTNQRFIALQLLPRFFTLEELAAVTSWYQRFLGEMLAARALVSLAIAADYDAAAPSLITRGTAPVTFVRTGAVAKIAV